MQIEMETLEGLERRLRFIVPAAEFGRRVEQRLREIGSQARFDGFRPGKAPLKLVAQRYGEQARSDVLERVLEEGYREGLRVHKLVPAGRPVFREEPGGDGTIVLLSATFEVYPEFTVLNYEGLELRRPKPTIEDEDLDLVIERLRTQHSSWEPVERAARRDDRITLDLRITDAQGRSVPGGERTDYVLVLGTGTLLPEVENRLIGMRDGDEADVRVHIPEEHFDKNLAGADVTCHVVVKEVAQRRLPEVDAAFVARFGMDDVAAWREEVRASMAREAESEVRRRLRRQVEEILLESNPIPVPRILIEHELEHRHRQRLRAMGMKDDVAMGESFRQTETPLVERTLRLSLIYSALIERLSLAPDPLRVERMIRASVEDMSDVDEAARRVHEDPALVRQFEELALEEQLLDWIVEHARVVDEEIPFRVLLRLVTDDSSSPSPSPSDSEASPT